MKTAILVALFVFASAANSYAQVDTLVDVGSYKLHVKILKGKGAPILFESGGALDAKQWDSISTVLHSALDATIITYDRQGFGKSGLDTVNYTILNEVKGLEHAITELGFADANVLLVAHSLGAFYSRLYAFRHPGLVKGIIMLDPRIPSEADMKFARDVFAKVNRHDFRKEELGLYFVLAAMERNSDFVRRITIPKAIPILNIMAEHGPFDSVEENERFKSAQKSFTNSRRNANLIYAKGSSHNIPQDMPNMVISEISSFYKRYLEHK